VLGGTAEEILSDSGAVGMLTDGLLDVNDARIDYMLAFPSW
jgi:hypothetical protein